MKKVVTLLLGFFLLISVDAKSSINDNLVEEVNNYIKTYKNYNRYILSSGDIPFEYENKPIVNSKYKTGGMLNLNEYIISKNLNKETYLFDPNGFWTMSSKDSNNSYAISNAGTDNYAILSNSNQNNIKITEFVNEDTIVYGIGSYTNPWIFSDKYLIKFTSNDSNMGLLSKSNNCNNKENSISYYSYADNSSIIYICQKAGYMYVSNSCNDNINVIDNEITTENINKDIDCIINFSPSTYVITLNSSEANSNSNPYLIYLIYNTKWYKDSNLSTKFTSLSFLPVKNGYKFEGYYTGTNGSGEQIIDSNGNILSGKLTKFTNDSSIYAKWVKNDLVFNNQTMNFTYDVVNKSQTFIKASETSNNVSYSIVSGNTSYFSVGDGTFTVNARTPAATYSVSVKATDNTYGLSKTVTFTINVGKRNINLATLSLNATSFKYTGSNITPVETVNDSGILTKNTHYTVKIINNKNVGTGTVTINGTGNYSGSKSINFTIYNPVTYTVTFNYNKATWNGTSTTRKCTAESDGSCSVTAPNIKNISGGNCGGYNMCGGNSSRDYYRDLSSLFSVKGWGTIPSATTAQYGQQSSIKVTGNTTYYAVVNMNTTYFITFTQTADGVFTRTSASGSSCSNGLVPRGYSISGNDYQYTSDAKNPIWIKVSSVGSCRNSRCTCYNYCAKNSYVSAQWLYW